MTATSGSSGVSAFITFTGEYQSEAIPDLIPNAAGLTGLLTSVQEATSPSAATWSPTRRRSRPSRTRQAALNGNNAQQRIIVNGSGTGGGTGFVINSSDSIIRGLIIDGFGVGVSIPGPGDVGDLVQGNFIGQYFVSQFDPRTGVALPAPNMQIFTGHGELTPGRPAGVDQRHDRRL